MRTLNKEILRLALPSILANLTVPLVGMVDIAVAGHLDSSAAALIGGVSIGSLMFDLLFWNFGFLRAGTGGMTAQAFGRGDWKECTAHLLRGVTCALVIAFALLVLQWPAQKLIFLFIDGSPDVLDLALDYFYLRIWAAPATLSLMAFRGWFIGMQDSTSSMLTDLTVNGTNIFASIFLALGIPAVGFGGIGFKGVALGTVIAQYSGLVFAAAVLFFKYRKIVSGGLNAAQIRSAFERTGLKRFFSVNGDLFVRSLCMIVVYFSFTSLSARQGDVLLAVSSIMMKLLMVYSYFTDGFAFAGEALTGKFVGRKDLSQVLQTVKWTFVWSLGIGMSFVGIYSLFSCPMFALMTSDQAILEASSDFIPWLLLMPLAGSAAFTWDGIYTGATGTKAMRNSMIGCVAAFYAVWWCGRAVLPADGDAVLHLLLGAYFAHLVFRSAYLTIRYRKDILSPMEEGDVM